MSVTLTTTITPDTVISFEINPGTLLHYLETRPEGGPRLKCYQGSVTLVSPGTPHETAGGRLASLVLVVCLELRIRHTGLRSTTWKLPFGPGDNEYEANLAYIHPEPRYVASPPAPLPRRRGRRDQPGAEGPPSRSAPGNLGTLGARCAPESPDLPPPDVPGKEQGDVSGQADEPGVPLPPVGRTAGEARRSGTRRHRLSRELPGMGQEGARPAHPCSEG